MPKPTTKPQIIETAQKERAALEELLATLTPEQMTQPNLIGEWAVKDVLAHLIEWEGMVMKWYAEGLKGKTPAVPSEEYNWGQLPQLNHAIFLKHRDKPLAEIMKTFKAIHAEGFQMGKQQSTGGVFCLSHKQSLPLGADYNSKGD